MNSIPRVIWGLVGLAALVLGAVIFLHVHDADVRRTAELQTVIDAKTDTVQLLTADIAALGKSIKSADSAYAAATGTVIRVAYVPPKLRDSLATLERTLADYRARGDSVVPIDLANQQQDQIRACRAQVDTIAGAVSAMATDCDRRVSARDSIIAADKDILRLTTDKLAATQKLAGLSHPRFSPFVGADYSPIRKQWTTTAGATFHLFAGLNLLGAIRYRDSTDAVIGLRYNFK